MKTGKQEKTSGALLILIIFLIVALIVVLFTLRNRQSEANATIYKIDSTALNGLQIPAVNSSDQIVQHTGYTVSYNEDHEQANWVAYLLTADETRSATNERTNKFLADPLVKTKSAGTIDYESSGYDRGHLAPAEDMAWSKTTMKESFYYSNMSPQLPAFNRGVWRRLEELARYWSILYDSIYIVTGPVLSDDLPAIGHDKVSVPRLYYKAILQYTSKGTKAIGFVLKNEASSATLKSFAVSIDSLEHLTGIDFFSKLPDDQENKIESNPAINQWRWTRKK